MDFSKIVFVLVVVLTAKCNACPGRCMCCLTDKCETDKKGQDQVCTGGCIDGFYQPRCMWPCPGNCQSCRQADGSCLSCKPGFYELSSDCSKPCDNCACYQSECDTCLDGFYDVGQNCNSVCSKGCNEGKCHDDGKCDCMDNFEGDKCDVCVQGKYGELCSNNCNNKNCRCTNATNCISCKPGHFDLSSFCSKPCSVGCEDICNNDGNCTCQMQFSGSTCENCIPGYYGDNCDTPCTNGCSNGTCNRDGTCDCLPNFTGTMCETCVAGNHGNSCDKPCGQGCTGNVCNKGDGTCNCTNNFKGAICEICNDGYYGNHCHLSCPDRCYSCSSIEDCLTCEEGFYGLDCSNNCSVNCLISRCEKGDGFCTDGCVDGSTGETCNDRCESICKTCSQTNSSNCKSCFGGFSGPGCKCFPNCQCELNSEVCNECINGFALQSKDCKCNIKYCIDSSYCTSCQNDTFYTYDGTCCECSSHCKNRECSSENQCLRGCDDGYTGDDCETSCTSFDSECESCNQTGMFCLHCKEEFYPNSGKCMPCKANCKGCAQDTGRCNECTINTVYGPFCNMTCNSNCEGSQCDRTSGDCTGCVTNMYGTKCDKNCPDTCADNGEKTKCNIEGHCINSCILGYEGPFCNIAAAQGEKGGGQVSGAVIGGGAAGGVIVVGVVVAAIVLLLRRSQNRFYSKAHTAVKETDIISTYENALNISTPNTHVSKEKRQIQAPARQIIKERQRKTIPEPQPKTEDNLEIDENDTIARDIAIQFEEKGGIYYNNSEKVSKDKIRIATLTKYVEEKQENEYVEEFEKFPYGLGKAFHDSQLPQNVAKNRYKGIYPYDETRVKIRGGESDFINASYIDGYNKRNEYIATLGPMSKQLGDFRIFWRMIWQEKVEKVVMVTNLIEQGNPKCEQYWPDPGTSKLYGEVNVRSENEQTFSDYTRRSFILIKGSEQRKLHHLHFTCWPDKDVPENVTSIIDFRQAVINSTTQLHGPVLVHCSAGVGRTGTYIALDILTNEGETEEAIAIQGCVINMRQNRPNMIQTLGQYKYLHRALVHSLTIDCQTIKGDHLQDFMTSTNKTTIDRQFQQMNSAVEQKSDENHRAVERNKLKDGNRPSADVPGDVNRPRLFLYLKPGASDYINAIYIDSFTTKRRYLVAQTPLPSTLTDFFTLVMQENCSCIVNLEPDLDNNGDIGLYFPADNQVLSRGSFTVISQKEVQPTFTKRTLKFEYSGATGTTKGHSVPHLQFTDWDKKKVVPRSAKTFLRFIDDVEEVANSSPYDGPILIHCLDGASKSGLFCVISLLIQRMNCEGEASVVNAVRKVRSRRALAIPCKEQFQFCYDCLLEYVNTHDGNTYCNIQRVGLRQ
ncbi:uncharacterized protein LOC128207025 isoform X2 [Mya arenaria]|uniref:uncharacterized protein LOC128207025 isoform X2 n=1 Tax=Mya arenaria TaxID=6604 RepID=UPI0022E5E14E|nr:uncharacterized protein LOC128207025 isoform X2 [Mya arenaria]